MAVRQLGNSPGARVASGTAVITSAATVDLTPITKRYTAFAQAHARYCRAEDAVNQATDALHHGEAQLASADVDQDAAVEKLAGALVGDGLPRQNPFKPFGLPNPSGIEKLAADTEAKTIHKLVGEVRKRKGLSPGTLAAAADVDAKATAVDAKVSQVAALQEANTQAIAARTALGRPWATAFARLKRAAQTADDDGADGLFSALFQVDKPARKKSATKPAKNPVTKPAAKPAT